ncbi:pantoate--beta-alanine ligase [Pseudochelatococcus contaminans]|uniref:Pantothenate synthetase n=1 Tax=Pseudochelatococcus contaminans TaxID=1538103 RepID=A0A7W6EG19_9HYPH|nr:pantoate--beta-alanine ligase [Pseudochelatococcus contaminans]MBB3809135.1 pantoate--beta-alanine ligase [Pseudochelatococcus contaminans]
MSLAIVRSPATLRSVVTRWKRAGDSVAVVPTMGALHEGHLSLVRAARGLATRVIVTLFVNPKQFNDAGDLANYPRTEQTDAAKLTPLGIDVLYAPDAAAMYPAGFSTTVSVTGVSEGLCGGHRPGHFDGVATVVSKLLLQTGADVALFGEKDFQQLQVIRRLVRDLDIPVDVRGLPTVREADGLAMSSRNRRLSPERRKTAAQLFRILSAAADKLSAGEMAQPVIAEARAALLAAGFGSVEYLELRGESDLAPLTHADTPARLLAAVWLDDVRLIDNVAVKASSS